jgi:hypothetical protein
MNCEKDVFQSGTADEACFGTRSALALAAAAAMVPFGTAPIAGLVGTCSSGGRAARGQGTDLDWGGVLDR